MRNTWLGNQNKAYPWDQTNLFSPMTPEVKKSYLDTKYSSEWRGMLLVSQCEKRSKSPIDKQRHGSLSQRTVEPELQEASPPRSQKKIVKSPVPQKPPISSRASYKKDGKNLQKNSHSPLNPIVTLELNQHYSGYSPLTPEKPQRKQSKKRNFEQAEMDRKGNIQPKSISQAKPKKIKPEFLSQIAGLPGTLNAEVPQPKPGNLDSYRARGVITTVEDNITPSKQRSNGKEQWRSSYDIIKHMINKKPKSK
jgi:hypothetical protein